MEKNIHDHEAKRCPSHYSQVRGGPLDILAGGKIFPIFFLSLKLRRSRLLLRSSFFFGAEAVQGFFFERLYTYLFSLSTDREKMAAM